MAKSFSIPVSLGAAVLLISAGPATADPTPDVAYPDQPQLQRAYESGFYRGATAGYGDGRDDGYDDGYEAGMSAGESKARDDAAAEDDTEDLRDDVEGEVQEGGSDLGPQITPSPTATPTSTDFADDEVEQPAGQGFPWWPLSFAVAATAWFVTRRRRLDAADQDGQHD